MNLKSSKSSDKKGHQQFIEMQELANNPSSARKESSHILFSDEDMKVQQQSSSNKYLNDQEYHVQRKAKSVENERHLGKKYKLDNNKLLTKEYSQDFLEEYKSVANPSNNRQNKHTKQSKKQKNLSKKFYESDANQDKHDNKRNGVGANNNNNNNLSDTMIEDKSDDDDEFLYYNYQRQSLLTKMCSCFTSSSS